MAKLDVKGIGMASAVVIGILYVVCFLIVLVFGASSLQFFQLFFHGIDITSLSTNVNIGSAFIGLIVSVIAAYLVGDLFALTYNKYSR